MVSSMILIFLDYYFRHLGCSLIFGAMTALEVMFMASWLFTVHFSALDNNKASLNKMLLLLRYKFKTKIVIL